MRNRVMCALSTGALAMLLGGCTQQELNADIQTASVISCILADGSQIEYAVAAAVVQSEGSGSGKGGQKVLDNSAVLVAGSKTLCTSLSTLNSQLQSTSTK